jgi:hypothetical protein
LLDISSSEQVGGRIERDYFGKGGRSKTARRWRLKEEKEEDIQIAQRIIADVKALLTCVPYLSSAPLSDVLFPSPPTTDHSLSLLSAYRKHPSFLSEGGGTHSYPIALGKQKSGAHHPKAPNVVLIAVASPPDGIDKKLIDRIKGDENVHSILGISYPRIRLLPVEGGKDIH